MYKLTSLAVLFASTFAGAQAVTVGSLTSSQNGVTTTITVPVSVAMPAVTTPSATSLASLIATSGNGTGTNVIQRAGAAFTTIALTSVTADSATAWNPTSNAYVVPTTGTYLIVSSIRLVDGVPAGVNYGMGVGSSNVDSPTFTWSTTSSLRNGYSNTRVAYLTAGTALNLFVYVDSSSVVGLTAASLNIQQLP